MPVQPRQTVAGAAEATVANAAEATVASAPTE